MRFLVTFISRGDDGATKRRDKAFDTNILTLGRGTDQTIHLRDPRAALKHATLVSRDDKLILRGLTVTGVTVNDKPTRYAVLKVGDRARVGQNILEIQEPPEGYDAAFTFELDREVRTEAAQHHFNTRLSETGLSPRRWAWVAVVAILLLGLLVPSMVLLGEKPAELLRSTPLPDDQFWSSGPLHNAHRSIGADCQACHTPFRRTPDRLCMECHENVEQHIPAENAVAANELSERRCASCHKGHEPASLVMTDLIVCTDCHANIAEFDPQTELLNVSGFLAGHAGFRASIVTPTQDGQWETVRAALADNPQEQSGLKFPHSKHMVPEGIKGANGDVVLQCADCHQPQGGGAVMRPVEMERDCQSCHRLDFEPNDPDRQALHAGTEAVIKDLEEYYSWRYLYGMEDTSAMGIDPDVFRRPGKISDRRAREQLTQAAALKAMRIAEDLIERRTCANCHEIETTDGWPGLTVAPVKVTERWLPKGIFSHGDHGPFVCADCHAAESSESAGDVLIPDVYTCGDCHSGTDTVGKTTTACIDCHGFHQVGAGEWRH